MKIRNDQERIEFIAKTMGIDSANWRPLEDDGDAFRLAAHFEIQVSYPGSINGKDGFVTTDICDAECAIGDDVLSSARRAIVLAAEEICEGEL